MFTSLLIDTPRSYWASYQASHTCYLFTILKIFDHLDKKNKRQLLSMLLHIKMSTTVSHLCLQFSSSYFVDSSDRWYHHVCYISHCIQLSYGDYPRVRQLQPFRLIETRKNITGDMELAKKKPPQRNSCPLLFWVTPTPRNRGNVDFFTCNVGGTCPCKPSHIKYTCGKPWCN